MTDEKLKDLQDKIDAAQKAQETPPAPQKSAEDMNKGMQILTEMIGIMIASGGIGYFLDYVFGTAPALLLIFLCLGIITFFTKLVRMIQKK